VTIFIDHRDTTNLVHLHQLHHITHQFVFGDGNRIEDHSVLSPLDDAYLLGLLFDGHVFVDDPDAAFAGNGNGQL
jgi:hypothetical protein